MLQAIFNNPITPGTWLRSYFKFSAISVIYLLLTFPSEANADGFIKEYSKSVFTNQGQSTVDEFKAKLNPPAVEALRKVEDLTVYVGYHGNPTGTWCRNFNSDEENDVASLAQSFPNATLTWISEPGLSDNEIKRSVDNGHVFFTWCDSDTRVKEVMGPDMPEPIRSFR